MPPEHPVGQPYVYLALGAGVQSSALFLMSALGLRGCPRADVAVFADTQDEPQWVYDHLEVLRAFGEKHGLPLHVTTKGRLSDHIRAKQAGEVPSCPSIPAWTRSKTGKASPLRRHCTRDYKIRPLESAVRRLLGYRKGQRMRHRATALLGISTDEASRMKPSRTHWVDIEYPLIAAGMSREDCMALHVSVDMPTPKKSSCVYCPFHSMDFWRDLCENHPEEWARAVEFDLEIRDMSAAGVREQAFLSSLLKPLGEHTLADLRGNRDDFENECEGHCGI